MISVRRTAVTLIAVLALALGACGGDSPATTDPASTDDGTSGTTGSTTATQTGGGSGGGFITLGDETITFESARCYLEPQDAAAGGGQILATGQGFGTNAAGEQISVDFTRFSEESQFAGDDINVTVGDPFSGSSYSIEGRLDLGAVSVEGNTLSVEGFTLRNFDDGSEVTGVLRIDC